MRNARPRVVLALASILCLAVGVPSAAQEPGASPGSTPASSPLPSDGPPAPTSLTPEASALAVEAQAIAAEVFAQVAEAPDDVAAEVRAAEVEHSGLAEVDPGLPAILAELEGQASQAFATFLADAPPLFESPEDASPSPSAGLSSSPSPEAGVLVFVAASRPGPRMDERRFDQGGSYLSSIGEALGYASHLIADFKPGKEAARSEPIVYARDGNRFRIDMAADHDTVTLIIEHSEQYSVPGATPESAPYSVTDSGGTTLQVDTCPDEDGTITVTANASGTYDVAGEGLSYHASLDTNDHATATVDDEAQLAGRSHSLSVRGAATGTRPAFAGGEGAVDSQLDASLTWSGATSQGASTPSVTLDTAEGVDTRDLRSAFAGGAFTAALVDAAIDAAPQVWRNKRCLELKVEPAGKTVDPGSETEITVTIEHKAFDEEVERDVKATLEGTKEIDPSDSPVRAPDHFTYTATDAQEGEGTITFRSVSNRGIAERTETYRVDLRLLLDADGTVSYHVPGVSARGTLKGRDLVVRLVPGDDPESPPGVTVTGDLQVQLRESSPGCSGNGTKRYAVDSAVDASAKVVGEGDERQLSVLIRPAQPSATFNVRVQCEGRGVTLRLPLSILFPHFKEGGELTIPLGGGQATRSGTVEGVRSTFTFTLRREQPPR